MSRYKEIPTLKKYVRIKENKNIDELEKVSLKWIKVAHKNKLNYEIEWLGMPVIQTAEDLILIQELVFRTKPDVIVETGIAHGGSLIYYASLFELLGNGKVIGIDIDIREHNRRVIESHPLSKRIEMIEGGSTSAIISKKIKEKISDEDKVLVCLDSNHTKKHVLKELKLYSKFVKPGSYIVVFDTNTSILAEEGVIDEKFINNGPMEAIQEFLEENNDFIIDKNYNKLFVSYCQNGYLKRVN